MIIRYRIKHFEIPAKLTKLQCGISWNGFSNPDSLSFVLPLDTANFQTARFKLADLYGPRDEYHLENLYHDLSKGAHKWPDSATEIDSLFLGFYQDTSTGIRSANLMDTGSYRYTDLEGTSEAAPVVSGIVALMLEKWAKVVVPGANLDTRGPWNSTVKAILIHTATDMTKYLPDEWEDPNQAGNTYAAVNPDLCVPVAGVYRQSRGQQFCALLPRPRLCHGYGLVNAQKALAYTDSTKVLQDSMQNSEASHSYKFTVPSGVNHFRVTLAWDDAAGDDQLPIDQSQLVNDLHLYVQDPEGNLYYPWVLNPLPQNIVGNKPPNNGLDPISPTDIQPAYQGMNYHDNDQVVDVQDSSNYLIAGTWKVIVGVSQMASGSKQDFSLVSDYHLSRITTTIGWIDFADDRPCPGGTGYFFMDDEATNNQDQEYSSTVGPAGPWVPYPYYNLGLYTVNGGTVMNFCRESIDTLPRTKNDYAVLQFSNSCPVNGISFARISDNENTNNTNTNSGNITPSTQTTGPTEGSTKMWFCYVKGDGGTSDPPWKSRQMGAFMNVNQTANGDCNVLHWYIQDDEDTQNHDAYDWSNLGTKSDSTLIKNNIFNGAQTETHYFWNACYELD